MTTRPAAVVLLGLALAGCGSSSPANTHRYTLRVVPANRAVLRHHLPFFVSPTRLAIETFGSSSCPWVPTKLTVIGPHLIRLDLRAGSREPGGALVPRPPASGVCTTDFGPTPMVVSLPSRVDAHHRLTIRLYYGGHNPRPTIVTAPAM